MVEFNGPNLQPQIKIITNKKVAILIGKVGWQCQLYDQLQHSGVRLIGHKTQKFGRKLAEKFDVMFQELFRCIHFYDSPKQKCCLSMRSQFFVAFSLTACMIRCMSLSPFYSIARYVQRILYACMHISKTKTNVSQA